MSRRQYDRSKIERYLTLRDREGLTYAALAARTGVPIGTLSYWSTKLRRESVQIRSPGFIELTPCDPEPSPQPQTTVHPSPDSSVRIHHPSGALIELRGRAADSLADGILKQVATWS